MNVRQFTRILVVLGRFSLVSSLLLVSSALGVMAGPLRSGSASEWEPYEPTFTTTIYLLLVTTSPIPVSMVTLD